MRQAKGWNQVITQLTRMITTKGWLRLATLVLCLTIVGRSLPARAEVAIDPKLREQVLQVIRENPEVILEAVQAYQKKQEAQQQQARQTFIQAMKTNPKSVIGQSPTEGAKDGRVILVEFSDFQCPFCSKAAPTIKQFVEKHKDKVTLVYKYLPLTSIHAQALPAAKAAWAAGQQGKFWQYHDALFAQQDKLGEELYQQIAKELKLDMQRFDRDRKSDAAKAAILKDIQMAENLGVDGTPFFVMNGEPFSGAVQLSDLEETLARVSP